MSAKRFLQTTSFFWVLIDAARRADPRLEGKLHNVPAKICTAIKEASIK